MTTAKSLLTPIMKQLVIKIGLCRSPPAPKTQGRIFESKIGSHAYSETTTSVDTRHRSIGSFILKRTVKYLHLSSSRCRRLGIQVEYSTVASRINVRKAGYGISADTRSLLLQYVWRLLPGSLASGLSNGMTPKRMAPL